MTIERILLVLLMGVLAGVVVWWFDATLRNESERRRERDKAQCQHGYGDECPICHYYE
jgi:hypothetical protein